MYTVFLKYFDKFSNWLLDRWELTENLLKYYENFAEIFLNFSSLPYINEVCQNPNGLSFFKKMLKIFCEFFDKIFNDLKESRFHTKYLQPLFPCFQEYIFSIL